MSQEQRATNAGGRLLFNFATQGGYGVALVLFLGCAAGQDGDSGVGFEKDEDASVRYRGSMRCRKDRRVI
ncbi:hypothetical protein AB0D78_37535 [Streptomyces avermitilis]|uniref:hypothetical protein n=1 Tax=Streptomyces avermitilis TaxID=33903 RepID=UPI0033E41DD2